MEELTIAEPESPVSVQYRLVDEVARLSDSVRRGDRSDRARCDRFSQPDREVLRGVDTLMEALSASAIEVENDCKRLASDLGLVVRAGLEGRLSERIDTAGYRGNFRVIGDAINTALECRG